MHAFKQVTMIAPAPGFSERVMARIAEREARAARRRAIVGISLLVLVCAVPVLLFVLVLVSAMSFVFAVPDALLTAGLAIAPLAIDGGPIIEALIVSTSAAVEAASLQVTVYALVVLGLTLFWMRVVGGSLHFSRNLSLGGSK